MSRRFLVLAVEIPDDVELPEVASGIRESLDRATEDGRHDGRVRLPFVSEAVGGWEVVDVEESAGAEHGWRQSPLVDRLTAVRLPDGAVQVVSEGGADPADDEATPDECFADLVLSADEIRPVSLALAAWSLR